MHKLKRKIYPINYLINEELNEDDLFNLFDLHSFNYSLVIGMLRHIGIKNKSDNDIIEMCSKSNNWFNKYTWTPKQRKDFLNKLIKVYRNVYCYSEMKSKQLAEWWLLVYGISIPKNNICN